MATSFRDLATSRLRGLTGSQFTVWVSVLALAGVCAFHLHWIMSAYYRYEMTASWDTEPPDETHFPGITVCAPTIFTAQQLASRLRPDREQTTITLF